MRQAIVGSCAFVVVLVAPLAQADEKSQMQSAVYEHLKPLEWLIGEWVNESESPGGLGSKTTAVWEWGPNKTVIQRRYVFEVAGKISMSGIGIIGWDAAKKAPISFVFRSDGQRVESSLTIPRKGFYAAKGLWISPQGLTTQISGSTELTDKNTMVD